MSRKKHNAYMEEQIVRLNSVGLSLSTISNILNCHPSTITNRMKAMGVAPMDSRRAFMEDILMSLPEEEQAWLVQLMADNNTNVKDYITLLLRNQYATSK